MGKLKRIFFSIIESMIRNISGGIGQKIRYAYYSRRFKRCGKDVRIDEGVIFQTPENISVGSHVWFGQYSLITAKPAYAKPSERLFKVLKNENFTGTPGEIIIGSEIHIGAYNIIQGYGGVFIGDKSTTSAGVKIYSQSNTPNHSEDKSILTHANCMVKDGEITCIESPIVLEKGVWLGLNVVVFAGTVGEYSFVATNSVVTSDIPVNSFAKGYPAEKIKDRFCNGEYFNEK